MMDPVARRASGPSEKRPDRRERSAPSRDRDSHRSTADHSADHHGVRFVVGEQRQAPARDHSDAELEDARQLYRVMLEPDLKIAYVERRLRVVPWFFTGAISREEIADAELSIFNTRTFEAGTADRDRLVALGRWFAWCARVDAPRQARPSNPVICPEGARRWRS